MENEIRCPNCGAVIKVDESAYNRILDQVRNEELERQVSAKEQELHRLLESEMQLQLQKTRSDNEKAANKQEMEIARLQNRITELTGELKKEQSDQQLAINKAVAEKEQIIMRLQSEASSSKREHELDIQKINSDNDQKISQLQAQLTSASNEFAIREANLRSEHAAQLKAKDEEVAFYRDFKARESTKMVGEDLEVHCSNEFNKLRPLFPEAVFEKDNAVSAQSGSKGDFIYRDSVNGEEFISVMFEMKNEAVGSVNRKKNEDFLKELDKDRKEKNCEYAVLVSMLEPDNELYNTGIVDMSHRYEKMYVIRPQFFIQLITILRNAALNTVGFRRQLTALKTQNVDLTNFEDNLTSFKEDLEYNHGLASRKLEEAIKQIDKAINDLNKTREALISSSNNFARANKKVQDITVKRLTRNAPTVAEKIREARENKGEAANADD